jgi:class 3 adenylate cyclase/TolB-like protein
MNELCAVSADPVSVRHIERRTRTVLIVDMVESVRLIEEDEEPAVTRWLSLIDFAEAHVLPQHQGRLVKSLGDGMLVEFGDVRSAASAAFAIQQQCARANSGLPAERQMLLRMGIAVSGVFVGRHDIYGRGVNLAARLATLAGPGEIVISAEARDQLTPALDAEIGDLGECYLKHIEQPVRAYRIGPTGPRPVVEPGARLGPLLPSIAVVPFAPLGQADEQCLLGDVLAEEMIKGLSRSPHMDVISRLSTRAFRARQFTFEDIDQHLDANYLLSGTYRTDGDRLTLSLELAEVKSQRVVWIDEARWQAPLHHESWNALDPVHFRLSKAIRS